MKTLNIQASLLYTHFSKEGSPFIKYSDYVYVDASYSFVTFYLLLYLLRLSPLWKHTYWYAFTTGWEQRAC